MLVGVSGSGKSTFAAPALQADRGASPRDFCRGLVADDENDQSRHAATPSTCCTTSPASGCGRAGSPSSTPPTCSRDARARAGRAGPGARRAAGRDRARRARGGLRRAQRGRPDRDFGRRVVIRASARDLRRVAAAAWRARASARCTSCAASRRSTRARSSYEKAVQRPARPHRPVRHHRRRARLPRRAGDAARRARLRVDATTRPAGRRRPPRGPYRGLRRRPGRPRPGHARRAAPGDGHGRGRAPRCACPATTRTSWPRTCKGRKVTVTHGLAEIARPAGRRAARSSRAGYGRSCDGLVSHYVLDGGRLVVAHAGLKEAYHGRASGRVRSFALYGDTTGETDEYGLPVRYPWAEDYRGRAMVVYGHTPVPEPEWVNNTICLDTGCVFGGRLTALRYPERELVAVPAEQVWYEPVAAAGGRGARRPRRPAARPRRRARAPASSRPGTAAGSPSAEENAAAALEVMSRFAVDPRWLLVPAADHGAVARPPRSTATWSTRPRRSPTTARPASSEVVCEEKHMGSRAVALVCRDAGGGARRGSASPTARRAPSTPAPAGRSSTTAADRGAAGPAARRRRAAGLWDELDTDWLLLDAELLPWSAKAGELMREPVRGRRRRRPGGAARGGRRRWRRRPGAGSTSAGCSPAPGSRAAQRRRVHATPTALLLADRRAWTGCGSRRSSPGRARAAATALEPHAWHLATLAGWLDSTRAAHADPARRSSTCDSARSRAGRSTGGWS